ncbi:hypothetical protein [Photorhabdus sp. RM96S]|uniref:hypothetical protein n=1 Tax=Photorhabdus sp. RM96S TaxID=3342822 RepID=UPI0036DA66AA
MTYFTYRHSSDLIDLVEQSVDHITLCLSIFWGFLSAEARFFAFLIALMPKQRRLDKVGATGHFPVDEVLTFCQRPFHERRERDALIRVSIALQHNKAP